MDQTSDPPGPDNQPKRPCGIPWRTRPLTTVMSGTGRRTTATSVPPSGLRITDNGLRITGRHADRGEGRERLGQAEPGVGDPTRLSGGESFCLCVCLGGYVS